MRNLLFEISYRGTNYCGYQVQKNCVSVAQVLQDAIEKVFTVREPIVGCSRTDSGVHANQYYFHMHTENDTIPADRLPLALNRYLPEDVSVLSCREVAADFHARYDCIGKEYFNFLEIFDDNSPVGFISLWSFPEFLYIEHFAIDVNCRSHGYGSLVLQKIKDEYKKPVILEAEIPLTTEQIKRIVFYDRNGFKVNSFPYIQPSYHGGEGVPLNILSYPRLLTDEEYNTFLRHTRKNVYCTD